MKKGEKAQKNVLLLLLNFRTFAAQKAKQMEELHEQKEGVVKPDEEASGYLYFDPTGIATFADLLVCMAKKVAPALRKRGLEAFLSRHEHRTIACHGGSLSANIYVMRGAQHNESELHIAEKLAKAGLHVLFPSQGDLGRGRRHDVLLYDAKTYAQQKVELKSLFGSTAETVKKQLISGSGQAAVIAYDIQSRIKKSWLIQGLRRGWNDNMRTLLLNYKGQWYQIDSNLLFSDSIYRFLK